MRDDKMTTSFIQVDEYNTQEKKAHLEKEN